MTVEERERRRRERLKAKLSDEGVDLELDVDDPRREIVIDEIAETSSSRRLPLRVDAVRAGSRASGSGRSPVFDVLQLGPLPDTDMIAMLRESAPDLAEDVVCAVVTLAKGNSLVLHLAARLAEDHPALGTVFSDRLET